MAEDRGFEVVDKRRTAADGGSPAEEQPEEPMSADEAEEEGDEQFGGMPDVTVNGVLWTSIQLLTSRAWSGMGLVPNPATGKIERDLNEARRAIDVLGDLVKHLLPDADDLEKRELQNMLTDLRVNFVRQSNHG